MVSDDRMAIIRNLIRAERKSPPYYEPARNLFRCVLEGKLSLKQVKEQARRLLDDHERHCAVDILSASSEFLRTEPKSRVGLFPAMSINLSNELALGIFPVWIRHLSPERLMILHFWQTPLSERQLSAAAAVLRTALNAHQPDYLASELDFVSVALPLNGSVRRFERYGWVRIKPLNDGELQRFWKPFCDAWFEYQSRGLRQIRRRRDPGLFDRR